MSSILLTRSKNGSCHQSFPILSVGLVLVSAVTRPHQLPMSGTWRLPFEEWRIEIWVWPIVLSSGQDLNIPVLLDVQLTGVPRSWWYYSVFHFLPQEVTQREQPEPCGQTAGPIFTPDWPTHFCFQPLKDGDDPPFSKVTSSKKLQNVPMKVNMWEWNPWLKHKKCHKGHLRKVTGNL